MVRVVSVSRVAPSGQQAGGRVKLSYLDVAWVWLPAVQYLFLYDHLNANSTVVSRLKAALAHTLTHYLPMAGRLDYEAETGDVFVDCSDASVTFIEAEAEAADGMDVGRLAYDEAHDMVAFCSLVPELDARALPAPVCAVQVTRLGARGLAVGLSVHHAVVDGRALWRFVEAWASFSLKGSSGLAPPIYCRDAVHYPRADDLAREWLNIVAPNLPVVSSMEPRDLCRLARRTFHLGAQVIRSLKQRIDGDLAASASASAFEFKPKPVSTFVALAALCWTGFVRAKGLGDGDDTYIITFADLRARLNPPVSDAYLGNCARWYVGRCADAAEIAGAARAVQALLAEVEAAPLPGYHKEVSDMVRQAPSSRLIKVVGSPSFRAYEVTDFGFGKPALVEVVSMNHDGEMMLHAGRRHGEVQISVSIDPAHMDTFKACILGYLPTVSRI